MGRKPITDAVKKKLFALSGNQCCFPSCTERVYNLEEDLLLGEMCHINAVNPNGARYDSELPIDEINSFDNILLLCPTHHAFIDKNAEKYDSSALREMKTNHENKFYNKASEFEELFEETAHGIGLDRIEELKAIDASLKPEVYEALPEKKIYTETKDYITRSITTVRGEGEFSLESKTLLDVIDEKKRITILGVAGSGKSIELANVAFKNSHRNGELYPVKIRLNTLTDQNIEELLELEYSEFKKIPHKKLLILLDALDEVHIDYLDIAVNNITILSKKYNDAKIVVSCRNNFYIAETDKRRAKLEGFSTYLIKPLDYFAVHSYLKGKIDIEPEKFIEDLRKKKYYDLLYSPFYLVNLVDYYNSKKEIPESKKTIFDFLIKQRIETDYDKYENSGVSIQDYSVKIEPFIEQLAVIAESMGKNYLDERTEVLPLLLDDNHLLKIIKRTFLFNKTPKNTHWEFEHNNFQEYLAARFLSRLSIEQIQEFVSFKPDFNKIKPSWLNTLSFLFSIVEPKSKKLDNLLIWIKTIEPDILIRFEKDKIDLKIREQLFKDIYEEYESKEIIIRNEKFESEDLALFVSDSFTIIEYLIAKIERSNYMLIISGALRMLPSFKNIESFKIKIRDVLLDKLIQVELSDIIKYHCLYAFSELKIFDQELTEQILKFNSLESGQYIRAGFYKYLENSVNVDDYVEILLKGIDFIQNIQVTINNRSENPETRLADEKYNLELLLDKIDSPKGVLRLLEWAASHDKDSYLEDIYFEQINSILKKATKVYLNGYQEVYSSVLNLLEVFSRRYYRELGDDFKQFFKQTNTEFKAFLKLYKDYKAKLNEEESNFDYSLTLVCNEEGVEFLINEIRNGRLVDPETWRIRNYLAFDQRREIHDIYQKELVKIDKNKYSYIKIDHEALKKARLKRDIELLFAKDEFLNEVKLLFEEDAKDKLKITSKELFNWRKKRFNDEEMSNEIIVDTLRDKARGKEYVELTEVEELVKSEDRWKWFTLHSLVKFDKNNIDFEFNENVTKYIKDWVKEEILTANFKTAIKFTADGYNYRYTELFISYFSQRLNIELSGRNYLDFLFVDCYFLPVKNIAKHDENDSKIPNTKNFLIEKLGVDKVAKQILQNIENDEITPIVKQNHFKYCQELNLKEATPLIFKEIQDSNKDKLEVNQLITQYLELDGNYDDILDIIDDFTIDVQLHATNLLAEKKFVPVIAYLKAKINEEENEETCLRYIQRISIINEEEAFTLLKKWVLKNKQLPDRIFGLKGLKGAKLNDLIEIFEDSLINKYGTDVWTSRNDYLVALVELGSKNENDYILVKLKLNNWLSKYSEMKFLHYQLQKLEQLYYSNKMQSITFDEARELYNRKGDFPKITKSKFKVFWESNKTSIDIILAILTLLGLIIGFLSLI